MNTTKEDLAAKAFGELVRERRKARGWSQEALTAEAFPNSTRKGYISLVENGKIPNITRDTVRNIARALEIDPEAIPDALRWPEANVIVIDTNKVVRDAQQQFADQKVQALAVTLEFLFTGPLFKPKIWVRMYQWGASGNWIEFTAWDKRVFSEVPKVIAALEELKTNMQMLVASAPLKTLPKIPETVRDVDDLLFYARSFDSYPRANEKFYWEASRRYLKLLTSIKALLDHESLNEGFRNFWLGEIASISALAGDIDRNKI